MIFRGILTVDRKGQEIHMDCDDGPDGNCTFLSSVPPQAQRCGANWAGEEHACLYLFLVSKKDKGHKMLWSYKICTVFLAKT